MLMHKRMYGDHAWHWQKGGKLVAYYLL